MLTPAGVESCTPIPAHLWWQPCVTLFCPGYIPGSKSTRVPRVQTETTWRGGVN